MDQLEFQMNIDYAEWQRAGEVRGRSIDHIESNGWMVKCLLRQQVWE